MVDHKMDPVKILRDLKESYKKIKIEHSIFDMLCQNILSHYEKQEELINKIFMYPFTLDDILEFDKATHQVFTSKTRIREIVDTRHIFMYLASEKGFTHESIGRKFNCHYSSSIHAVKKIKILLELKDLKVTEQCNSIMIEFNDYLNNKEKNDDQPEHITDTRYETISE
jgi:chromosomal replication initiation ATPase DnaA